MSDNIARILALAAIGAEGGGGGGGALTPIVVYELPTVGEEGVLYLVPRQVTETQNVFDEYIYVNGGWEKIGSTDIDFSNYYTKQEVDTIASTLNTSIGERYLKPSGGIPNTDLSSGVQADLNKAKTALQTESDPVFGASAAAGITSSDITSWNNKLSSESDPVFSASVASGITNTDITNWNNKQDSPVEMTVEAIYHEGSGYEWYIGVEDVNTILDLLESGEKLALTLFIGSDSWYASGLVYFNRFATSGDDYVEIILPSVSNTTSETQGIGSWTGTLIRDETCILFWQRFQDDEHLVNEITGRGNRVDYPTTEAVYDFTNTNFLSKTNTNSYTPSANYHPATKKYVDDKASNYLAKNNTTAFTPTGDYQPATKKYVDDNSGGDLSNYLAKNNTTPFTPSGNYNPATKKYVDDKMSTALKRTIVSMLPQYPDTNTIYMLPSEEYHSLPDEYQPVEYLESHGTEYINTGYNSSGSSSHDGLIVKIINPDTKTTNGVILGGGTSSKYTQLQCCKNSEIKRVGQSTIISNEYFNGKEETEIRLYYESLAVDGQSVHQFDYVSGQEFNYPYYLFAGNLEGTAVDFGSYKLKSAIIYDDGSDWDVRQLYPCYRIADGEPGLYDLNTKTFFTNQGTGKFGVGKDIPNRNSYTEYMYIKDAWEIIGSSDVNLADYATIEYVDRKVPAFFDGSKSEWDALTQEQQKSILFAAVNEFELTSEEEAILLGVLGDKTGIDTDTELEETLNAFLNIAGENE